MLQPLLVAILMWSSSCNGLGLVYLHAAMVRDRGDSLENAQKKALDPRAKAALRHVYQRPDMKPRDWQMFMVGVCTGMQGTPAPAKPPAPRRGPAVDFQA